MRWPNQAVCMPVRPSVILSLLIHFPSKASKELTDFFTLGGKIPIHQILTHSITQLLFHYLSSCDLSFVFLSPSHPHTQTTHQPHTNVQMWFERIRRPVEEILHNSTDRARDIERWVYVFCSQCLMCKVSALIGRILQVRARRCLDSPSLSWLEIPCMEKSAFTKKRKILTMNENCAEMDWRCCYSTGPCLVATVASNYDVILPMIHFTVCGE